MSEPIVWRATTAGLATAYQLTSVTTGGALVVEETGGSLLVGVRPVPRYLPLPLGAPSVQRVPEAVAQEEQEELAAAYRAMADQNRLLAEESLPIALEGWPAWEER